DRIRFAAVPGGQQAAAAGRVTRIQSDFLTRDRRGHSDGAKTLGTDGSVHAAPGNTMFHREVVPALGRSRQSPRFRASSLLTARVANCRRSWRIGPTALAKIILYAAQK